MDDSSERKRYDLKERTYMFAKNVRDFVKKLPRTVCNFEDVKQLVRSSGSVGANYIEANEALSKKDFAHRLRIARKEAKESRLWLRLLHIGESDDIRGEQACLIQESME